MKNTGKIGRLAVMMAITMALALAVAPVAGAAGASSSSSGSQSSDGKPVVSVDAQVAELTQLINSMDGLTQAEKDKLAKKVAKEFTDMARGAARAGMTPDDLLALVKQAVNDGSSLDKALDLAEKQVDKANNQQEKQENQQEEQENQQEEQKEQHESQDKDDGGDKVHGNGQKDND